jgi:DNA-directed RNA polymerase subunit RPC12/RpoP
MNRFACYHCGKHLSFRLDQFGMHIKCPKCQQKIQVGMAPKDERPTRSLQALLTRERLQIGLLCMLITLAVWMTWNLF